MARPIPVGPRDVAYQPALASGKGVVRDVAILASDPHAPLERKVQIFRAASDLTATDRAKFDGIIEAVALPAPTPTSAQQRPAGQLALPQPEPEREPPAPPHPPVDPSRVRTPAEPEQNGHDVDRSTVRAHASQSDPLAGWPHREHGLDIRRPKPRTPRSDTGRSAAEQRELRERREKAAAKDPRPASRDGAA